VGGVYQLGKLLQVPVQIIRCRGHATIAGQVSETLSLKSPERKIPVARGAQRGLFRFFWFPKSRKPATCGLSVPAYHSATGRALYTLKTPYRDGATRAGFEPVEFIARLAALVPRPRVNLTRYHGVLAPNHRWRGEFTPARRGLETTTKDLQADQCACDLNGLNGHRLVQCM
jgi:hypothetical protein